MARLNISQITQSKATGDLTGHLVCSVVIFMRHEVAVAFDLQKQILESRLMFVQSSKTFPSSILEFHVHKNGSDG